MRNCTCKKWGCDSECLCNCHRETFPELQELNDGLNRIGLAVDRCIKNLNNQ